MGGGDGALYAVHASTGTVAWRFPTRGALLASPALSPASGSLLVGSTDGTFYSLNASSGALQWAAALPGGVASTAAVAADGQTLAFGCADGGVYALAVADGSTLWAFQTGGPVYSSPAAVPPSLQAASGVAWVVGSSDGCLYGLSSSGALAWKTCLVNATANAPLDAPAAYPSAADILVAALARASHAAALCPLGYADAADESAASRFGWTESAPAACSLSTPQPGVAASPVLDGAGVAYVGAEDGGVYAAYVNGGAVLWRAPTGGAVAASCAIAPGGVLLCGSGDGALYAWT